MSAKHAHEVPRLELRDRLKTVLGLPLKTISIRIGRERSSMAFFLLFEMLRLVWFVIYRVLTTAGFVLFQQLAELHSGHGTRGSFLRKSQM